MVKPVMIRKITIRRLLAVIIVIAVAGTSLLYYFIQKNKPLEVQTTALVTGDISSKMYVKAQINPSAVVNHTVKQKQRVLSVLVKPGDQVAAGDILLTLDRQELQDQYDKARKARQDLEAAAAAEQQKEKAKTLQSEREKKDLEVQISNFSGALTRIVQDISLLNTISNNTFDVLSRLGIIIEEQIAGLDPSSPDLNLQIQNLIDAIIQGFDPKNNPQYQTITQNLEKDMETLNASLPKILAGLSGSLTSNLTSGISISAELSSQLKKLGLNTADPLASAIELEKTYKEMLDQSVTELVAESAGIVAEVNVQTGSYAGNSSSQSGSSINSLVSEALGSANLQGISDTAATQKPAIVIYNNTALRAVFQVSQFDSTKLKLGMSVEYVSDINDTNYQGKITYKSPFVQSSDFSAGSTNDLLRQTGLVSALGQEPQLVIEMSIEGKNLTDLVLGFLIDAEIITANAKNVLILPAQAMRRELGEYYVFIVGADNRLIKKPFVPGIQSDMFVEAVAGLTMNDLVVQNPTGTLQAGQKVRPGGKG